MRVHVGVVGLVFCFFGRWTKSHQPAVTATAIVGIAVLLTLLIGSGLVLQERQLGKPHVGT